jgi:hypothetical protein
VHVEKKEFFFLSHNVWGEKGTGMKRPRKMWVGVELGRVKRHS